MDYLIGNKEDFFSFVEGIREWEKIAILTHNDLDGLASALFLEKVLNSKDVKVNCISFLKYKSGFLFEQISKFRQVGINKVFLTDLNADAELDDFNSLRENFDCFLIDHHPINPLLENKKNILKTPSKDCVTAVMYSLGEGIIDKDEWEWLVCATMFSEASYKDEKNFLYMKSVYPTIAKEDLASSIPGLNARKIGNALIYYLGNERIVYDLVKEKNLEELEDVSGIVDDEINFHVENYLSEAKFYPERNLYIYELKSKYEISSPVVTIVSNYKPNFSFVLFTRRNDGTIKFSARNQAGKEDMNELMKKGVQGLSNAFGGGHKAAAGATILEEDFEKFMQNILR